MKICRAALLSILWMELISSQNYPMSFKSSKIPIMVFCLISDCSRHSTFFSSQKNHSIANWISTNWKCYPDYPDLDWTLLGDNDIKWCQHILFHKYILNVFALVVISAEIHYNISQNCSTVTIAMIIDCNLQSLWLGQTQLFLLLSMSASPSPLPDTHWTLSLNNCWH